MKKINKCILCNHELKNELKKVRDLEYNSPGEFNFQICKKCNIINISPIPTLEDLKSFYPQDYHGFHTSTSQSKIISLIYKIIYAKRFKEYIKLIGPNGNILDIGCADADYFDALSKKYPSLKLNGIEFKDEIAEIGRKKGRKIITGTINDIKNEKFDLIIMNNLIEHVLNPEEELKKAYDLLNPNGYIIIETPNIDCWDYILTKKHWGGLHTPRHIFIFSPKSIRILIEKTKFKIKKIKFPIETSHWAISIQNYFQQTKLKSKIKKGRVFYFKYLIFLFIPLVIIQAIIHKNGYMKVIIQK